MENGGWRMDVGKRICGMARVDGVKYEVALWGM